MALRETDRQVNRQVNRHVQHDITMELGTKSDIQKAPLVYEIHE